MREEDSRSGWKVVGMDGGEGKGRNREEYVRDKPVGCVGGRKKERRD